MKRLMSLLGAALLLGPAVWLPPAPGAEEKLGDEAPVQEAEPERIPDPIVLTEADAGKTIEAAVGHEVVVRLKGNPTTGFRWDVAPVEGDAVELKGEVAYEGPGRALPGAGGTFVARFQAVHAATIPSDTPAGNVPFNMQKNHGFNGLSSADALPVHTCGQGVFPRGGRPRVVPLAIPPQAPWSAARCESS